VKIAPAHWVAMIFTLDGVQILLVVQSNNNVEKNFCGEKNNMLLGIYNSKKPEESVAKISFAWFDAKLFLC
jgi:hypothetical protein